MLAFYVFSLILGGGFLGLSLLGDFFESDVGDVDVDVDLDLDVDAGIDVGDADLDAGGHGAARILSIRTFVYALFGFGAVGTILSTVGGAGALVTAAFAVVGGIVSGGLIDAAFRYLKRSDSGAMAGEDSFVGLLGRVTLPLAPGSPGRIAVEQGARRFELRALPHPAGAGQADPSAWKSVVIVEMERGVALVTPVEEDLRLEP